MRFGNAALVATLADLEKKNKVVLTDLELLVHYVCMMSASDIAKYQAFHAMAQSNEALVGTVVTV
jgi:hypothetical protein